MRNLIILRGCPACGKSYWVREMGLEPWTLSSDDIRLSLAGPQLCESGNFSIPQNINRQTFELLFKLLEDRMKRGELIVVDATHSRPSEVSAYSKFCKQYRYRRFFVEFDTPLEKCLQNDLARPAYKQVPAKAITKIYNRIKNNPLTDGWTRIDKDKFWETINYSSTDFGQYDEIHIIGDVHGCYEPLVKYYDKFPFNENFKYIFVGDYLDRGIQNKETIEFLIDLSKKQNVTFLEGNHEKWLSLFANGSSEEIKSHEFIENTFYQIDDVDRKAIREFCRKLNQISYFDFDGHTYLVNHGGISSVPDKLICVSTEQLIKGVGGYSLNIDDVYKTNCQKSGLNTIQVHGHRNISDENDGNLFSYNLEGKVEHGGFLKVLRLCKGQFPQMLKFKNDTYKKVAVMDFQKSELVKEKVLTGGISSFNFTKDAFFDKKWDEVSVKARGLFVDTANNKVVARGYEKFFNINETFETKIENLSKHLKNNIVCYRKENGFLGILSYVNDDLMFFSKSTNEGDFAGYFKALFEKSNINKEAVKDFLKNNDFSLVFEVIDKDNDPHIIKANESKLVLLDAIENCYEFKRLPYSELVKLANEINCPVKTIMYNFANFDEFKKWYDNANTESLYDIEGLVIEDGNFMCKMKFDYYLFWKYMRSIVEALNKYGHCKRIPEDDKGLKFYNWIIERPDLWSKDIITIRDEYEKS